MGWITDSISLNFYIICKLLFHVEKHCLMQNANPPFIWSKWCFFFLVWTLALQPLFDLNVLIIFSVWKCWWHRNTAWYSLCSSLTGNTTNVVMWISPVGDYRSCKKRLAAAMMPRRNVSYQTSPVILMTSGEAYRQERHLLRSLLRLASILGYPKEPIIPGFDRSPRL